MMRAFLCAALLAGVAFGQSTDRFEVADVHVSPRSDNNFNLFMRGPQTRAGRYEIRTATMVDLISTAYGVDGEHVYGGPNWLEMDRFDITAKLPAGATAERQKAMLQALLAERFHLVAHPDTRPMPAYILTVGKRALLKDAVNGDAQKGCQGKARPQDAQPTDPVEVACHGLTAAEIADNLHNMAGGYLRQPVVDSTGLKGTYDFDLKWTGKGQLAAAGADGISIFDAVDKQLGLKLELLKSPLPVINVESVNQKPTENPADASMIPTGIAVPDEFEVAEVKLTPPDFTNQNFQILPSGRVDIEGFDLKFIIQQLWQLSDEMMVGAPKWLGDVKVSIVAKAPAPALVSGQNGPPIDIDTLIAMIKNLLVDRFKLQTHTEERPINAFTLSAAKPKMKPADPNGRIKCAEGPGAADQKDVRDSRPILGRLLSCQNMTMSRFAGMLQGLAPGYIKTPVLDATNLEGSWDFTLSFSSIGQLQGGGAPSPEAANAASDPNGALSLPDAISKQLGLKLEQSKRPVKVLVIDHVEPKPTEN